MRDGLNSFLAFLHHAADGEPLQLAEFQQQMLDRMMAEPPAPPAAHRQLDWLAAETPAERAAVLRALEGER